MWIRFSAYAPASADSTSDSTQDFERLAERLEQSAWWRGKPSPSRSWERRLRKGGWTTLLSGSEICENYPRMNSLEWTGSPEAIHASPSAKQENDWEKTTLVICGRSSSSSSELFDLAASSSRTSLATCRSASIASFKTWRDAVSAARSDCLQRRKSARLIDESESSSSGWPTPTSTANQTSPSMTKHPGCRAFWPTPRASTGGPDPESRATGKNLQNAVASWPTPTANEDHAGLPGGKTQKMLGNHPEIRAWPTPMARDHKDGDATANVPTNGHLGRAAPRDPTSHPGQLNPDWVEMLMGFPIGWTASELSGTR
jgi:hypothetical protein